jgi:type IV pilus assembly protein PilM
MIGIEIWHHQLKVVVVKPMGNQFKILAFEQHSIPLELVDKERDLQFDEITQLLKSIRKNLKTRARKLAITIPDSLVMEKVIQLEKGFDSRDKEFAIQQEFAKLSPISIDELNFDFIEIENDEPTQSHSLSFQVYASRKEWTNFYCKVAKKAGFNPVFLDSKAHGLLQVIRMLRNKFPQKSNWTLIDVGSTQTTLCISTKQSTDYVKNIPVGYLSSRPLENAVFERSADYEISQLSQVTSEGLEMDIVSLVNDLTHRLHREIQLYNSIQVIEGLGGVWLSGEKSFIDTLQQSLEQKLAVKIERVDLVTLLDSVPAVADEDASLFVVATGVAINGLLWEKQEHA